jgi:hypothetical protein
MVKFETFSGCHPVFMTGSIFLLWLSNVGPVIRRGDRLVDAEGEIA